MPADRPHVIAVFGGNGVSDEVVLLARTAGAHIALCKAVTLTGGDGTSPGNVKDEASLGARPGAWVGVLNDTGAARDARPDDGGLVVLPEVGHQRNLLEAWLCDVAIVFQVGAGGGTLSELVSTMCLGKPVLLVGAPEQWASGAAAWRIADRWFSTEHVAQEVPGVAEEARTRLGAGPLSDAIADVIRPDRLVMHEECARTDGAEAAGAILDWVTDRVAEPQIGYFPDVDALSLRDVGVRDDVSRLKGAYDAWLERGRDVLVP